MPIYDIVFVGSGLSSSSTLYHILSTLQKQPQTTTALKIAVIEKSGEFFKGIAYGRRTSIHSLTINPVKDFFQEQDKPEFFNWFNELKKNNWPGVEDVEKGILNNWFSQNAGKLNHEGLNGVYIPRFLYGLFLSQKLTGIIADCEQRDITKVDLITGEAVDAEQIAGTDGYLLAVETPGQTLAITANVLVLTTGCLDVKRITNGALSMFLCIDDVYSPSLAASLDKISEALAALPPQKRNVLIIGSNASASELVHILSRNSGKKQEGFNKIVILSGSGLPDRLHVNADYDHLLDELRKLEDAGNYTADALIAAIERDVKNAAAQQLSVGKIHYSLSDRVFKIQQKLNPGEALKFFNEHAWAYTRITRRTSEDYYFTEQELVESGKLQFIKGRFIKLCDGQSHPDGLRFMYKPVRGTAAKECDEAFPVIINCSGSEPVTNTTTRLIRNMLDKGLLNINHNNMGLAADEQFAAAENLYIMGPLLAGIYTLKYKFWHLENAKRLNGLTAALSNTLVSKMVKELA